MTTKKPYKTIIDVVPEHSKVLAQELISEMEFMKVTLIELKQIVKDEGAIVDFVQGKQKLKRENPALKSYTSISGRYNQYVGRLRNLIPEEKQVDSELNELKDFLLND